MKAYFRSQQWQQNAVVRIGIVSLTMAFIAIGCSPQSPAKPAASTGKPDTELAEAETPDAATDSNISEAWDAIYVGGTHVGYSHTTKRQPPDSNGEIEITSDTEIGLKRFGTETHQSIHIQSVEIPNGQLKSASSTMSSGTGSVATEITNSGDKLVVVNKAGQGSTTIELPADCLGIGGFEPDLQKDPMQAGETRTYRTFVPLMNTVGTTTLTALHLEETKLLGETRALLRIENAMTLPGGNSINVTMWADGRGDILKTDMSGLQTTYRTTREKAIPSSTANAVDLGTQSLVRLDQPIESPHQTKHIRYLVKTKNGVSKDLIPESEWQHVAQVDSNTIRLDVQMPRPANSQNDSTAPPAEFTASNSMIQKDAEAITLLAAQVPNGASTWETVCRLESFVSTLIDEKNFSTAFASAEEVAKSKQGDCTEHSVLLCALCRAKNVPSRCTAGLVYSSPHQAFAFHMWTEAWIDGHWIPLDATLGIGGIGAAHIKISDTSFADGGGFESMLPVIQLIGNLEIDVEKIE
ncbi:MAG: transglutaminase domain-containing protein [Planctomycetales bacterium]|nr:transglutaminase domain-containing protein [Planctomycetales bacterium]